MKTIVVLAAAITIPLLGACASTGAGSDPSGKPTLEQRLADRGYKAGKDVSEIDDYRIDGWNSVDEQHLILSTGPSRDFLITVMTPCTGLSTADPLAFTTTTNRLTRLDKVIVQNTGFSSQCPIKQIQTLERIKKPKA